MKLLNNNFDNNLLGFNCVNSIFKSGHPEIFEQNSSSDSLLTLLDAGIKRQSQGDANEKEMFSKTYDRSTNLSDIIEEPTVRDETVIKTKGKHKERSSEEVEIGSELKHKKKKNKYTDISEDDINNVEINSTDYSDNAQKEKRNRSLNLSADPTVADEIVRKKKGKHKEVPSEEIKIESGPKQKQKHKKNTDTSEGDCNDNTQKNKCDRSVNLSDIIEEPTVENETVRKTKGKHKEGSSEEVEIGSEHKHKKKKKKYTDTSEDDVNNVKINSTHYSDNTQKPNRRLNFSADPTVADEIVRKKKGKHTEVPSEETEIGSGPKRKKKHDRSMNLSAIIEEPLVEDETVRKTKSKHKELPSEEVEIGSELKHKKKNKRDRSVSSNDIIVEPTVGDETVVKKKSKHKEPPSEEVEIGTERKHKKKNTDTSEDEEKKKRDKSVSSNDIIAEPTVGDETVVKKKSKHKDLSSEDVEIGSERKHKKKKKKYTDTSEDDEKKKRDKSVSSNDIIAEPTVGDETVVKKKSKHKDISLEDVEIGSERKHKKRKKKYTDTSEDDEKKKRDKSVSSNDIIVEPTVGDETVVNKKSKHKDLSLEDVEIGSERKHKKRKKKYTDTSEDDEKKKRDKSVSSNDIIVEPTVGDETVVKKKSKHKDHSSEDVEIGSERKHKKKKKKYTETSEDDEKKKRDKSVSSNDIIVEPTVGDQTVVKKKRKHKDLSSEEVEIGSERKHKKKKKKYTDMSEDDEKKKRDESVSSNDIIAEPTVGDETVVKKKSKHKEPLSEEVQIESERKHKKKKKHTDASERGLNDGDGKLIRDQDESGKIKKRKRDISIISSDLNSEPSVVEDDTIREKKKRKHKKFPQEEIKSDIDESFATKKKKKDLQDISLSPLLLNGDKKHKKAKRQKLDDRFSTMLDNITEHQASGLEPFELPKSNKGASLDITDANLIHSNIHSSTPFEVGKRSRSFTPPKDDSTVTDEAVKSKEDTKEDVSDSDDPYYDNLLKEKRREKSRPSKAQSAIQLIRKEKPKLHDDAKFLQGMHVLIPFDVPQTHLIETRISSKPTQKQKEQFKSLKVTLSTRPYTKAEDASIKTNWEEFCRTHDVPNKPELFMSLATENVLHTSERINFARFLGRGLEHRMLFSIYGRFKVLFGTYKKGKFTPEEDATIRDTMQKPNVANKFSTLATMLGRSRESIKSHYKVLNSEKVTWTLELMKDLIENLMKVVGKKVIDELKTTTIERLHWEELEKVMGISGVKLRLKWMEYIYPRLFAGNNNNVNEVRTKLINLLYDNSQYDRKEINWNELALDFDGMSGNRLYKIFVDLMSSCVPKHVKENFKDAIDYLKNDYLVGLPTNTPRSFVRLYYENGKLWESRIRT